MIGGTGSALRRLSGRVRGGEDGYIVIIVALALTVVLGAAAYTFDGGRWRRDTIRLQASADAAAIAGARQLPATSTSDPKFQAAIAAATAIGDTNLNQANNGEQGSANMVSATLSMSPGSTVYDTIQVTTSDTQSGTLARAVGVNSVNDARTAVARVSAVSSLLTGLLTPLLVYQGDVQTWGQNVQLTVDVGKNALGTPGNFDAVTLPQTPRVTAPTQLQSDPGAAKMRKILQSLTVGETIFLPVYDSFVLQGRNAQFHIVGFAAFHIDQIVGPHGNTGQLVGEFLGLTMSAGTGSPGSTNYGLTALNLIQ